MNEVRNSELHPLNEGAGFLDPVAWPPPSNTAGSYFPPASEHIRLDEWGALRG